MVCQFPDLDQLLESLFRRPAFRNESLILLTLAVCDDVTGEISVKWGTDRGFQRHPTTQFLWRRIESVAGDILNNPDYHLVDPESRRMAVTCRNELSDKEFMGLAIGCANRVNNIFGVGGKLTIAQTLVPFVTWCQARDLSSDLISEMALEILEVAYGCGAKINTVNDSQGRQYELTDKDDTALSEQLRITN